MELNFNLKFKDLYEIKNINDVFLKNYNILNLNLIQKALIVEKFIIKLFNIEEEFLEYKRKFEEISIIHKCKRHFIERIALKKYRKNLPFKEIEENLYRILNVSCGTFSESLYVKKTLFWLEEKEKYSGELEIAAQYAIYMVENPPKESALFKIPKKLDYENLIILQKKVESSVEILEKSNITPREGFNLIDEGFNLSQSLDHSNYCLICHTRKKDTCRKGFIEKDSGDEIEDKMFHMEHFKLSPTKVKLKGCPLDEKISEVNFLHSQGNVIAALIVITLDNPFCAVTGHRICNDCMRSCIYQKQEPVNFPAIETNILDIVLNFPYGFEIYSLLTKWNPLNENNKFVPRGTNYKILVSGLGPAGFTLSHYLLNERHTVVAIDGCKIENLPSKISGILKNGKKTEFIPIKNIEDIYESLSDRVVYGFGGVMEYGITTRWNKNYLKLIRIILERRNNFHMFGSVRFGSNITAEDAKQLGFDHIALASGSGAPNIPSITNVLCRGVRFASDFLMLLQLGGAFKKKSLTVLQIRMPIIIIGAGLTAVDAATESLTYYKVQVEKFLVMYELLLKKYDKDFIKKNWNEEEKLIAEEFILHAKALRRVENSSKYLKSLGGVKILYRKRIQDSPAYRLNYEELQNAFNEGVEFIENITPKEIISDQHGSANGIKSIYNDKEIIIPAKAILIATGTKPNNSESKNVPHETFLTKDSKIINLSVFGDLDKDYSGSVVSAMASAKDKYKFITKKLEKNLPKNTDINFTDKINNLFRAKIIDVKKFSDKIFEIIIYAPFAAKNFSPGQFYKLQNFESSISSGIYLNSIEPIALTGACVKKEDGIISLIVLEAGVSTYLSQFLKKDEFINLMGPVGMPTEIPKNENIILIGGGLGNAVLFSIAEAMKKNECNIIYFAGYKNTKDRFKAKEIEKNSNIVIWCCDEKLLKTNREQDISFRGNIIEGILYYFSNNVPRGTLFNISDADRVLTIGSDSMMCAVKNMLYTKLKPYLKSDFKGIASINSPMQCMMKEICGQCVQKNSIDGKQEYIYSCSQQDQDIFSVDFNFLNQRLKQNSLIEKINYFYVKNNQNL